MLKVEQYSQILFNTRHVSLADVEAAAVLARRTRAKEAVRNVYSAFRKRGLLTPPAGQVLRGRYVMIRRAGTGGMGVADLAVDASTSRFVVIKRPPFWVRPETPEYARLRREFVVSNLISHPNVVRAFHFEEGCAKRPPFLVLEYASGLPISQTAPVDPATALRRSIAVADALKPFHALGIIHRDVKPSNVVVDDRLTKLIDCGIAYVPPEWHPSPDYFDKSQLGYAPGTLAFASPQQILGETPTAQTDIYGLGSVLYFSLTGTPPVADSLAYEREVRKGTAITRQWTAPSFVGAALASCLERMLSFSLDRRFRTIDETLYHLHECPEAPPQSDSDFAHVQHQRWLLSQFEVQ